MEWLQLDANREEVLSKILTPDLRYEFNSQSCVSGFLFGTKLGLPHIVDKSSEVFSSCTDIVSLNLISVENWKAIIGRKKYLKRHLLGNLLMWVKESPNNMEYLPINSGKCPRS
jgi:hypothetical protein